MSIKKEYEHWLNSVHPNHEEYPEHVLADLRLAFISGVLSCHVLYSKAIESDNDDVCVSMLDALYKSTEEELDLCHQALEKLHKP